MTKTLEEKITLCTKNTSEIITADEIKTVFSTKKNPKAYIGFELSGMVHLGTGLIAGGKIIDLLEAGCEVVIFLADWHSWINNKLGGNMKDIQTAGKYFQSAFEALGITSEKYGKNVSYLWASELVKNEEYWAKVVKIAKKTSLNRTVRALPIMGRTENQMDMESAWIFYPPMQAADIFHMNIDIALGGMDQRKAHVLAREAGEKLGWGKPVALHTPLLSGLKGEGDKMDMEAHSDLQNEAQVKMSKSKPDSCIFIHESPEEIIKKLQKAFCPPKIVQGNPVMEICQMIIFPRMGALEISRPEKYGGNITFKEFNNLKKTYQSGKLHPSDLKSGVAKSLAEYLSPVREYYKKNPKPLDAIKSLVITR